MTRFPKSLQCCRSVTGFVFVFLMTCPSSLDPLWAQGEPRLDSSLRPPSKPTATSAESFQGFAGCLLSLPFDQTPPDAFLWAAGTESQAGSNARNDSSATANSRAQTGHVSDWPPVWKTFRPVQNSDPGQAIQLAGYETGSDAQVRPANPEPPRSLNLFSPGASPLKVPLKTPQPIQNTAMAGNLMVLHLQNAGEAGQVQSAVPPSAEQPAGANPAAQPVSPVNSVTEGAPVAPLSVDVVAGRKAAADERTELSDDVKAQLTKHYQRATELLTQKTDADKRAADLKAEKDNGPALIADAKTLLAQPAPRPDPEFPGNATVTELEQLRLADDERAAEARRNLEAWEAKAKTRSERKPQMPALIETTRKQVEDAEKAFTAAPPEGELPIVGIARRTEQEALILLLKSQLELYRIEQTRYEALNELFPLQRDLLTRTRSALDKRSEQWKAVLAEARRAESARQAQEARLKLQNADPTLRDLAEQNSLLTQRRKALQEFLATKTAELSAANATLTATEQKFRNISEKEHRAGLTTAIGLLLRNQRNHLPDARDYRQQHLRAEKDLVRLQTEQMLLEDERNDLGDIETQVETTLGTVDEAATEELRQMAHEMLTDRRKYLDDLLADYDSGVQTLGDTDVVCRRLVSTIEEYESYIDERVLWIRSAAPVDLSFPKRTLKTAQSFLTHRQWIELTDSVFADMQQAWVIYAGLLVAMSLILGLERRTRIMVAKMGDEARRQMGSGIPQTLLATFLTILMASAWPLLLGFCGWRLSFIDLDLATALTNAFYFSSAVLWQVNSLRRLCRNRGVADSFLEWPLPIVKSLRANLLLYLAYGVPLCFVVVAAETLDGGSGADTIGRVAFVCFCCLLTMTLRRMIRPNGPVIGDLLRSNPNSVMYRSRWLWYPLAVTSPLCLAGLALMGYLYTAEQLMVRLQLTICLSVVLLITYTMLMQWMLAAKRDLAIRQARARRAAALAAAQRDAAEDGTPSSPLPPFETPQVDLSLLNHQVLRIIQGTACILFLSVAWTIWGQMLPALQVFGRIELWSIVVNARETISAGEEGASAIREVTRVESVTLGHLLLSISVFTVALLASRNVPGLLELAVLQKLPMDHGGRNAITTLCRYAFVLAGTIVASNVIGVSWGSVQWLVAALTVGLGFGLQEIFANFVSGLIILFERPVRIGDVVTIDGLSGCVSRIQIRATTITDWDRKEYIVPNKEFVTGKLLNWTLSDKVNRVVIKVGVAYGTDTEQALAMLENIAIENPLVLSDPPPIVGFEGFGESCLDLVLRCYLANLDHRLKVITQLHVAIDRAFKEAGIEIAFPQRDLHIRSFPGSLNLSPQQASGTDSPSAELPDSDSGSWKRSA
ncbi:MAG: mechanosensitive ion channel [Planctomycetaceae bacterium]